MPENMDVKKYHEPALGTVQTGAAPRVAQGDYLSGLLYFTGLIALYKIVLDISYQYLADSYSYQGLFYNDKSFLTDVYSWILLICGIPFFKKVFADKTISGNILSILVIFSVIPTISAISYRADYELSYIWLQIIYWLVFFVLWSSMKPVKIRGLTSLRSKYFHNIVLIVLSVSVLFYSYTNTGIRLHFSLIDVYDLRAEARNFEAPFPLNYLVSLADNILPFFAVYALFQRRYFTFALVLLIIYINFSISGTKQVIFVAILGVMGYFFVKDFSQSLRLIYAAIALVILSMAESLFIGTSTLNTFFAYRVLFIPAELHYSYYSYFQTHEILYFSQSILKWLSSGEQENVQFLLGEYAIGEYTARANNGLFSDAYMNLGVVGVLVYPLLLATFLRILDGSVDDLPKRILFVVTVYVGFVLLGMTFTSALLTSGLIFLIFLLYSMPRNSR
nr:hypothetical protein [uncultured Sphingomonas sp.]